MKTLHWKRTNWTAQNFIFSAGRDILGQLTFHSNWNFKAVYTDQQTKLKFVQESFWSRDVLITEGERIVGKIRSGLFGGSTLTLPAGDTYVIATSLWEQEVYWKTEQGETIIKYQQAIMSSLEKGVISFKNKLPLETEKLLMSSGLFIRQMRLKRIIRTVVVMIPIMAAAGKL